MNNQHSLLYLILGCVAGFLIGSFTGSMHADKQLIAINGNLSDLNKALAQGISIHADVAAIGGTTIQLHRNKYGDSVIGSLPDSPTDNDIHPLYFFVSIPWPQVGFRE